jgi:hypothetical protein
MTTYYIHNNYIKPYKVYINNSYVKIYKKHMNNEDYEEQEFKSFKPEKIFIGKSPKNKMTLLSGGHGKKFDGNTILLQLKKHEYVYIGLEIYSFTTDSEIINYESPVGNNDIPYPYAIDQDGYYYLMIENVKLKVPEKYEDCYQYYYQAILMTPNIGFGKKPIFYSGILDFKINNESYTLIWVPSPKKDFKKLQKDIGKNITIKTYEEKIIKLTEKKYLDIMNEFNKNLQAIKFA